MAEATAREGFDPRYQKFVTDHFRQPKLSLRGRTQIEGIVRLGLQRQTYYGTGLSNEDAAVRDLCRRIRERKRAFLRYVVRELGGDPRTAAHWARVLSESVLWVFEVPEIQAKHWVRMLELRQAGRYRRAAAEAVEAAGVAARLGIRL